MKSKRTNKLKAAGEALDTATRAREEAWKAYVGAVPGPLAKILRAELKYDRARQAEWKAFSLLEEAKQKNDC